ncbi:hypothetical protein A2U01_0116444, partial [Trifolium medium]|nr:hypothetical protein [Trifolium medium]
AQYLRVLLGWFLEAARGAGTAARHALVWLARLGCC